jgi:hypothetical protein
MRRRRGRDRSRKNLDVSARRRWPIRAVTPAGFLELQKIVTVD